MAIEIIRKTLGLDHDKPQSGLAIFVQRLSVLYRGFGILQRLSTMTKGLGGHWIFTAVNRIVKGLILFNVRESVQLYAMVRALHDDLVVSIEKGRVSLGLPLRATLHFKNLLKH